MKTLSLYPVGRIETREERCFLALEPKYAQALLHLDGFSHLSVLWWFDQCEEGRKTLTEETPYAGGPERIGVFATRSPNRPNPLALSVARILCIDHARAEIEIDYIDAENGSPVLDIKPYTPSLDRVEHPQVPDWCAHWPQSVEQSGEYDWSQVFPS